MSESVHDFPPFTDDSTERGTSTHATSPSSNPLLSLDEKIRYVSPLFDGRMESEQRHAERRHAMLIVAAQYYDDGQYSAAISELKYICRDLEISGDTTYIGDIESVIQHCIHLSAPRFGHTALNSDAMI